ncbi:MAG: oligosaccharide flippase family protein [Candidatus Bathyarchaeota archaeon]|nr:oligosaccharide flippase family protein [Candidatus Bathyarchaeota archaeon]
MDKARDMGKSSATGRFQLLIGVVGSTVVLALGTLILSWILTRDQLGLYSVALIPASMINYFRDWGVNSAMTKQIASLRVAGKETEIHDVIVSGTVFELISGAILALASFGLSGLLAQFLKMPEAGTLIAVMSLSVFASAVIAATGSIFVGFERMKLNSLTTILQAVVKTAMGPVLVVLGFGVFGAIMGTVLSLIAGAAISIAIVYFVLFRPIRRLKTGKSEIGQNIKGMLSYGAPLMVSNMVVGLLPLVFAFLMAPIAGTALMGDYYAATYFTVVLTFITVPITTALVPTFAKVNPKTEPGLLKKVFTSSVKYTSVIIVPATMILMTLANPLVNTLWPGKFPFAPLFLALSVILNLYAAVGYVSLGTLMIGLGDTRWLMIQSLLSLVLSMPIVLFMLLFPSMMSPLAGALLGIVGILLSNVPGMIWGLSWIWKRYRAKADFGSSAKIFAASTLASVVTFLFLEVFSFSPIIGLVTGFFLFLVIYLGTAPLIGAVNQADVDNLRTMFSGLGTVSKILEIPLRFVEIPLAARSRKNHNVIEKATNAYPPPKTSSN